MGIGSTHKCTCIKYYRKLPSSGQLGIFTSNLVGDIMNNIILSGKVISLPVQVCDYKACSNKFFNLLTDWGQITIGIDNHIAGGINVGEDILIKGKLSRLVSKADPLIAKYKQNDFIYVDTFVIQAANRADLNELTLDAKIVKQTTIGGGEDLIILSAPLNELDSYLYCRASRTNTKTKDVRVVGKLYPSMLDNFGNLEYIISANKILDKQSEETWGK